MFSINFNDINFNFCVVMCVYYVILLMIQHTYIYIIQTPPLLKGGGGTSEKNYFTELCQNYFHVGVLTSYLLVGKGGFYPSTYLFSMGEC